MRTIRYKLLEYFENGTVQLFNLRDDMGEQNDLSKIEGRKAKELTAKLHQWRKDVDAQMMPPILIMTLLSTHGQERKHLKGQRSLTRWDT